MKNSSEKVPNLSEKGCLSVWFLQNFYACESGKFNFQAYESGQITVIFGGRVTPLPPPHHTHTLPTWEHWHCTTLATAVQMNCSFFVSDTCEIEIATPRKSEDYPSFLVCIQ